MQSAALGQFQGFVKTYLDCLAGLWANTTAPLLTDKEKVHEELLKNINRTSQTALMPQAVVELSCISSPNSFKAVGLILILVPG